MGTYYTIIYSTFQYYKAIYRDNYSIIGIPYNRIHLFKRKYREILFLKYTLEKIYPNIMFKIYKNKYKNGLEMVLQNIKMEDCHIWSSRKENVNTKCYSCKAHQY